MMLCVSRGTRHVLTRTPTRTHARCVAMRGRGSSTAAGNTREQFITKVSPSKHQILDRSDFHTGKKYFLAIGCLTELWHTIQTIIIHNDSIFRCTNDLILLQVPAPLMMLLAGVVFYGPCIWTLFTNPRKRGGGM